MQKPLIFVAGAFLGGLFGGVAGYVINDLTERENPEVIQEIQAEQAQQEDFEDFLDQLAAAPPGGAAAPTPSPQEEPAPAGSGASHKND